MLALEQGLAREKWSAHINVAGYEGQLAGCQCGIVLGADGLSDDPRSACSLQSTSNW